MLAGPLANLILGWMTLASLGILTPVILAYLHGLNLGLLLL